MTQREISKNKPELPFALGMEGSGVISQMGSNVKNYKIGDEVMFGGWGTWCHRKINCCFGISFS